METNARKNLVYNKNDSSINRGKKGGLFDKWYRDNWVTNRKKINKLDVYLPSLTKINSKQIKD